MTCNTVQQSCSLYLYGELDFAAEEAFEEHLECCAACRFALDREKSWHTQLKLDDAAMREDVQPELLAVARRELFANLPARKRQYRQALDWVRFFNWNWSRQLALASFFLFLGMGASRYLPRSIRGISEMSILGLGPAYVRDIQPQQDGRVRIVVDRVQQQELVGAVDQKEIRQWLLASARSSADPGLRVDSVELLSAQGGEDIRDALIGAAQHDTNAAVRLKAVTSLRSFASDVPARRALMAVLRNEVNPAIRSAAIDVLLPANARVEVGPDLLTILTELSRSTDADDYVRVRSAQILRSISQVNAGDVF